MRQAIGLPSLFLAANLLASAQQPTTRPVVKSVSKSAAARAEAATVSTQLPVTRVALYKNGVGFFEHTGRVTGNQSVTIDFTTAQLNDVLQSLTAIDLNGGRIAGAGYNSTTPLNQQLKALPLALGEDPTAVDFYNAIRGARVEVRSGSVTITGRLLNIEVVNVPEGDNKPASEKRLITVIGDAGEIRSVELNSNTEVRLLDADLHTDVTRYLQLLASTRNLGPAPPHASGQRNRHPRTARQLHQRSPHLEIHLPHPLHRAKIRDHHNAPDRNIARLVGRRQHHGNRLDQRPTLAHRRRAAKLHPATLRPLLLAPPGDRPPSGSPTHPANPRKRR